MRNAYFLNGLFNRSSMVIVRLWLPPPPVAAGCRKRVFSRTALPPAPVIAMTCLLGSLRANMFVPVGSFEPFMATLAALNVPETWIDLSEWPGELTGVQVSALVTGVHCTWMQDSSPLGPTLVTVGLMTAMRLPARESLRKRYSTQGQSG